MADVDIMDLFDKDFVSREEETQTRQSGIHDYKPSRSYGGAARTEDSPKPQPRRQATEPQVSKASSAPVSDIDEKLVWVGAIFVFFGVFAFLLGYWLGNIRDKEVTASRQEAREQITQRVAEQQTESALRQNALTVQRAADVALATAPATESARPATPPATPVAAPQRAAPVVPSLAEASPRPAPARTQPQPQPRTEAQPAVRTPADPRPRTATTAPPQRAPAPATGEFTIQVSAHTVLERAQSVETQLRQAGFMPYIVQTTINNTTFYRVRAGNYGVKTDAESSLARVRQLPIGRDAFVISLE